MEKKFKITTQLEPLRWYHFLLTIEFDSVQLWLNGVVMIWGTSDVSLEIPLNGTLIIGQEQDDLGGAFSKREMLSGQLYDLRFMKKQTLKQVQELSDCEPATADNSPIIGWERFPWKSIGKFLKLPCHYVQRIQSLP